MIELLRRIAGRFSIEEIVGQDFAVGIVLVNDFLGRDLFVSFGRRAIVVDLT